MVSRLVWDQEICRFESYYPDHLSTAGIDMVRRLIWDQEYVGSNPTQ